MAHADLKLARLLVVKIQTENATHLMFPADSAAWIISTTPARKFPSSEFNFSLCPSGRKKAAVTHQLCFSYSDSAHRPSTRLFTLQSPKVGAEQSGPSATALPLINWMLRFHVGNPREGHHLQLKGVQWRHQCLQHTSTALKSAQYVCQSARSCSPTFDITVKNLSYPETALKCHNRQHFIQISSM